MTIFESIILGLVQGLAEFLPISSSGHLAAIQYFFGISGESVLTFAVLLHLGTLISLVAVYYRDLWNLIKEFVAMFGDLFSGKGLRLYSNPTRKLGFMIIVAVIPAGVAGILFDDFFNKLYNSLLFIGVSLLVTGTLLWIAEHMPNAGKDIKKMKIRDAALVGILQAIAICPGISRSGSTIVGGLFSGLSRELTVRFAFLVSVIPILGAVILEAPDAIAAGTEPGMLLPIVIGVVISAVSGYLAIRFMIKLVTNKGLGIFSYYTWAAGLFLIIYSIVA